MRIFSWNVNGLRAVIRKGALQDFIKTYHPDILCLQETKISEEQVESEKIHDLFSDYEQHYSFAEKRGYSGTAIWMRITNPKVVGSRNIKPSAALENPSSGLSESAGLAGVFKARNASEKQLPSDSLLEGRITTLEFADLFLISAYVPNSKDDLSRLEVRQEWDKQLIEQLDELQKQKPVIVCGDFNVAHQPIDLARPKPNEGKHGYTVEERAGFDGYMQHGFIDSFRHLHPTTIKYSWWSHWGNARANNVGWRIDYFLISNQLKARLKSADIYPDVEGSDHCPISVEIV